MPRDRLEEATARDARALPGGLCRASSAGRRSSSSASPTTGGGGPAARALRRGREEPGRSRLGGRVEAVSRSRARRAALDRPAVGEPPPKGDRRRDRPRTGVRDRRSSNDPALPRVPRRARARKLARCRLRLRRAAIAARKLGFGAGASRSTPTRRPSRRRRETRRRTASKWSPAARCRVRRAERRRHRPRESRSADPRSAAVPRSSTSVVTSGYDEADHPALPGFAHRRAPHARRIGRPISMRAVASCLPMATFSVRFLGCKVSHADAHAVREALLRDGHVEQDDAEIAVVNTCCVTHEAVSQVAPRGGSCGTHPPARLRHGLWRKPRRRRLCRAARERHVVSRRSEETPGVRRRRRRRDRLRAGGRAPRSRPCLRPRAGRLQLLVQLLRDPARAGGALAAEARKPCSARYADALPGASRGRPHRDQPRLLPGS